MPPAAPASYWQIAIRIVITARQQRIPLQSFLVEYRHIHLEDLG